MKAGCFILFACTSPVWARTPATFHKDVEPILQRHCQGCHHPGDIAPMPLLTYEQSRPWAKAIRAAVVEKKMPPWFAHAPRGTFLNDPSLTPAEIETLTSWADSGAIEGDPQDAPPPREFSTGWHIGTPDAVIQIPKPFQVPARGAVPYQYIIVPTNFTEDKWVRAVEVHPSNRKVVHHIIASSTPPSATGARTGGAGGFFTSDIEKQRLARLKPGEEPPQFSAGREGELLQVFVPGGLPPELEPGQAKLIKAGSTIMFQLHYTTIGTPQEDQTSVGFIFAKEPPRERVKGILVYNTHFTIPAGMSGQMIGARAEVLHDMKMVSMLPHMHVRGKDFQFRAIYPSGESEVLLGVPNYDFNWQINYYLATPKFLPKGTVIECTGHYDNSPNNPYNPDATNDVHYGEQTWEEMLNGFMEVAIEPSTETPELLGTGSGPYLPADSTAAAAGGVATRH